MLKMLIKAKSFLYSRSKGICKNLVMITIKSEWLAALLIRPNIVHLLPQSGIPELIVYLQGVHCDH